MVPKRFRFTTRSVEQLPPHDPNSPSRCAEYTDTTLAGFKVQVNTSGRKFLYFRYTYRGLKRAYKIGEFPAIGIDEARATILEMRGALDRGNDPQESRDRLKAMPNFAEYAGGEYMPFALQYKRSADDDESKIRRHLNPAFGTRRLCDISMREIQIYLGKIKEKLSPASANRHLALLSRMFVLAVQWGRVDKNPCIGIKKFKENGQKQRFLSPEEVRRVVAAAEKDINFYAGKAVQLLLLTGIRREECCQSRWEHVDLEQGTLFLAKTKSGRSRYVVLNDSARKLLAELPRVDGSPWVFPGRDPRKPLNNPRKAWLRILAVAEVEVCRLHDCRHTHASLLVNAGASLYQVQAILGHASPQTTQRYSHLASQTLRDVSQMVSRVVENTPS